jgi:hypothetical protein
MAFLIFAGLLPVDQSALLSNLIARILILLLTGLEDCIMLRSLRLRGFAM